MTDTPRAEAPHQPQRPDQITRFFDWIRGSGLNRDGDRWIAGVCGGIAARIGLDPLIVRGIVVVIAILGGPAVFAYAVGWALMPRGAGRIYAEEAIRGRFEPAMVAIGAVLLFTAVPLFSGFWWDGPSGLWAFSGWLGGIFSLGWGLAITAGVIWLVVFLVRRAQNHRPTPPAGPGSGAGAGPTGPFGPGSVYDPRPFTGAPTSSPASSSTPSASRSASGTSPTGSSMAGATDAAQVGAPVDEPRGAASGEQFGAQFAATTHPPTAPYSSESARNLRVEQNRAWQEQNRARQADRRARIRARRPGAGYSAIVLGLAWVTGAVAAGVYSNGSWSQGAVILGVAVALGVLALGIVIAGIRGRTDGAMGGFAFAAAITLVVLGVFPQGTQFTAVGSNVWALSANSEMVNPATSYAMVAGQTTLDLSDFDNPGLQNDRVIDVWLGAGETRLILPADAPVRVETHALVGGVEYSGRAVATENSEHTGLFASDQRTFNASSRSAGPLLRIWTFAGVVVLASSTD
ncbi:PspC domain-containing protein [Cryobacterium sp. PH29-G1]|uniref:PspC domain-containing protein n=1 Tax=Cryobacterium sp. PH29-G1 TaxID=3046211 RepID=UPI0024B89F62|nr:PspC domain-containing protein [Cryobacterium sp. PH29-G1]MDJ0350904.1 PspC domain-containing protein [Cryobacterium sp. PH29-G1]